MDTLSERFLSALDALRRGDDSEMDCILAEDVEFVVPGSRLDGHDAVLERFRTGMNNQAESRTETVIDAGDSAAIEFLMSGERNGGHWELRATDHVWWRDGKIYHFHAYYDPAEPTRLVKP